MEVVRRVLDFSVFRMMDDDQAMKWFTEHHGMGFFHYSENLYDVWRDVVGRLNEVGFIVRIEQGPSGALAEVIHPEGKYKMISAAGLSAPEAISLAALELVNTYPDILKIRSVSH